MTSNRPSGRPSNGGSVPPTSRRSARQQRLAAREANRTLARAGTRGSSGPGGPLLLFTLVAVVIAAVVIGGAYILTNQSKAAVLALGSPNPPVGSAVTPKSIPSNGLTLGNANAPHTIDVYGDFQCTVCRDFTVDVEPEVIANYVATGKAKLVWHDFIVIDHNVGGTESLDAANAARCANDQGMFWPYHDWLYANQYAEGSGAFTKDRLKTIGKLAGIPDLTKFDTCVDSGTHNAEVQAETHPSDATGTPSIYVDGGSVLSGTDYATISAALDKALGVTPSPSAASSASASAGATATPTATPAVTASPS
jgi:protein-disulfide isomerase